MGASLLSFPLRPSRGGTRAARGGLLISILTLSLATGLACAPAASDLDVRPTPRGAPDTLAALPSGELPFRLEFEDVVGTYGSGPGQMARPQGVAVDNIGRIFVADTGNNRVERFDPAGVFLGELGGFGFGQGQFDGPRDLAVDGFNLWVLDVGNLRVLKYDLEGRLAGTALDLDDREVRLRAGRIQPSGLAIDQGGIIYIADSDGDRVFVFRALNASIDVLGSSGTHPGRFRNPSGIAVTPRSTLIVADGGNARVQALDSFGSFLRAWPISGPHRDDKVSVAWMPGSRLAVAEADSSRITVLTSEGRLLARLDQRGSQPGQLDHPGALAVDRLGRLFVADTANDRIQIFRLTERRSAKR